MSQPILKKDNPRREGLLNAVIKRMEISHIKNKKKKKIRSSVIFTQEYLPTIKNHPIFVV